MRYNQTIGREVASFSPFTSAALPGAKPMRGPSSSDRGRPILFVGGAAATSRRRRPAATREAGVTRTIHGARPWPPFLSINLGVARRADWTVPTLSLVSWQEAPHVPVHCLPYPGSTQFDGEGSPVWHCRRPGWVVAVGKSLCWRNRLSGMGKPGFHRERDWPAAVSCRGKKEAHQRSRPSRHGEPATRTENGPEIDVLKG